MSDLYRYLHTDDPPETYRNELKYICPEGLLQLIQARISPICPLDAHTAPGGIYNIRSVYFDDSRDRCFFENEDGTDPREKFRIRIYNGSDARIRLECKKKQHTMTNKVSCRLSRRQCDAILDGTLSQQDLDSDLLRKFYALYAQDYLRAKVIVAYERTPFVYAPGNVRITFDRNIGSSTDIGAFFDSYLPLRPVMPTGKHILEVKYDALLPDYLYQLMNLGSLQQTAFSKYYLCRKFTV